jgi:uroporphyrinogen III methyltransferase/synthase
MKKGFVYLAGPVPRPGAHHTEDHAPLSEADCIVYDYLANASLLDQFDVEKIYVGKQGGDHTLSQDGINALIIEKAKEGKTVVRLKGGDPFIFGRGGEEAEELVDAGIPFAIIPGISSFYSAPAYAGIPVTHRDFANALEVITGHRRSEASEEEDVNFPEYDPFKTFAFLMGMKNLPHISDSLVREKNFPADTPVGIISWGTRPEQKVVTGTLATIAAEVEKKGMKPPAIIVVGKVVSLRGKLRWFDNQPLFGKTIVVTRSRSQASRMTKKLLQLGARVIEFPTIDIAPVKDMSLLEEAMKDLVSYKWIIFTSQNAVNIFFDELFRSGRDVRALNSVRIAVIGEATGRELKGYGLVPDVVPRQFVAESLLESMTPRIGKGDRILLPCSEDARPLLAESLRSMGAVVDRIHIYTSVKPELPGADVIASVQKADCVTFASSSTARNFFEMMPHVSAPCASIGPITSKTLRELGHDPVIEAGEFTIDGLVGKLVSFYEKKA